MKSKKAEILHETLIFVILNVLFFSILIVFVANQSSSLKSMEERNAKQIALLIDESRPGTELSLNLKDFFDKIEVPKESSVKIDNEKNLVIVKGTKGSFYDYHYFNDVDVEYNVEEDWLVLIIK